MNPTKVKLEKLLARLTAPSLSVKHAAALVKSGKLTDDSAELANICKQSLHILNTGNEIDVSARQDLIKRGADT